jgi:hypothetical protein
MPWQLLCSFSQVDFSHSWRQELLIPSVARPRAPTLSCFSSERRAWTLSPFSQLRLESSGSEDDRPNGIGSLQNQNKSSCLDPTSVGVSMSSVIRFVRVRKCRIPNTDARLPGFNGRLSGGSKTSFRTERVFLIFDNGWCTLFHRDLHFLSPSKLSRTRKVVILSIRARGRG